MTMQAERQSRSRVEQFDTTAPRVAVTTGQAEPSLGQLLNELTGDMSTLVRQEFELAKAETMQKVSHATRSIIMLVAGGLLAYAGLIALVIAAAIGLGALMPYWLSSLIVGLVVVAIGALLVMSGRSSLATLSLVPEDTVATLRQDARWAKEQIS